MEKKINNRLKFKVSIPILILIFFGFIIFVKFIKEENDEIKLRKYEFIQGEIIKIKHYGVHSPAGFYYTYRVKKYKFEGYTSGKIPESFLNKKIKIKYALSDYSVSEVYNLDSLLKSGNKNMW